MTEEKSIIDILKGTNAVVNYGVGGATIDLETPLSITDLVKITSYYGDELPTYTARISTFKYNIRIFFEKTE